MSLLQSILSWFSGGEHQYMRLAHCMQHDYLWMSITITLDLLVAVGYVIIATHWYRNEKSLPPSPARTALRTMRNIFAFCGICGYLFIPIKMFWPAWRLYDMFLLALVFYTWRYALNVKNLKVIYSAMSRSNQLAEDLAQSREESKKKSFFLNAISHDLRTPLNGLMLHADLAQLHMSSGDQPAAQQSVNEIKASARLTADLLDGLLQFARLETAGDEPIPSEFELGELITDVLNSHAALALRKSLQFGQSSCPTIKLHTDRLRLERILNNLIGNAIKFTDSGSVRIEAEPSRSSVSISVVDTGIGISPEHQARLFEEFFQVQNHERDRQKGFGLGLAICHRLACQLGGDLEVQSAVGQGSRFTVVIPRLLPGAVESDGVGRKGSEPSARAGVNTGKPAGAAR